MTFLHRALRVSLAAFVAVAFVGGSLTAAGIGAPVQPAAAQSDVDPDNYACQMGPRWLLTLATDYCADPSEVDANETHVELIDQWSIQEQNYDTLSASFGNYLNDSSSIGIMEGKEAYIDAMESGNVTKAEAREIARQAVNDYYVVKQKNLLSSWKTGMVTYRSMRTTAKSTSDLPLAYFNIEYATGSSGDGDSTVLALNASTEVTLMDNSTKSTVPLRIENTNLNETYVFTPASGEGPWSVTNSGTNTEVQVIRPTVPAGYDSHTPDVRPQNYGAQWAKIDRKAADARQSVSGFVNATYEEYLDGNISTSDLVDPYLGAREYEPNSSESFALRSMAAMGIDSPENLSNTGLMRIEDFPDNTTHTGILMTDNAPSGGFSVNETYNAANINGSQFVALESGGSDELTGKFAIREANDTDGNNIQNLTYSDVNYTTANASEFEDLQAELNTLQAEINARQDRMRNTGGGAGWLDFGGGLGSLGSFGVSVGLIAAAGGALFVLNN